MEHGRPEFSRFPRTLADAACLSLRQIAQANCGVHTAHLPGRFNVEPPEPLRVTDAVDGTNGTHIVRPGTSIYWVTFAAATGQRGLHRGHRPSQ